MDESRGSEGDPRELLDVLVIGGGPAGSAAALYAARAKLATRVLDRGMTSGALGATRKITNYPGVLGEPTGAELVERMRAQAKAVGAEFRQERVMDVTLGEAVHEVLTPQGGHLARTLIVATGSLGRMASLPGEARLLGRGVSYCATCDGFFFADREVAVVGDNDEALEEALFLSKYARIVYLLAPRDSLRAAEPLVREIADQPKIEVRLATRVREILGGDQVQAILVAQDEVVKEVPVAGVFVYTQGAHPVTDFLGSQLKLSESGCIEVDSVLQTSMPGVFAAGDVLCKHLKQAVTAAAEGATAAMAAERYLAGRDRLRPDWA
jgi:thioredoxin reductase (NADPH)